MQRDREHDDVEREETIGEGDKAAARQCLHEPRERHIHHQHADERAGEQPRQIVDAACETNLVADWAHDVVGRQHREDVEPAPRQRRQFLAAHIDDPAEQPVPGLAGAGPPFAIAQGCAECYLSVEAICRISSGVCTPASGVRGTRYFPIARPPTTAGSKPISLMSRSATATAFLSSPAIGTPTGVPSRCASCASWPAPIALKARTILAPGSHLAVTTPAPP